MPSLALQHFSRSYPVSNGLLLHISSGLHSKGRAPLYFFFISDLNVSSNCISSASGECFTCGILKQPSSNLKVFSDVPVCRDNELIMGIGKLSGIANYEVNAVERNQG